MRRRRAALRRIGLGTIALSMLVCAAPAAAEPDPGGSETAIVPLPPPAGKWFGFNDHSILHEARDVPARSLARLTRNAGANIYRMTVDWREVESERDVWDEEAWQRYEEIARTFRKRGQRILVTLSPAPIWARDVGLARLCFVGISCAYPPAETMLGEWAEYVREVVRRIPGAVIETWNEPNLAAFWKPLPEPERWARLHAVTFEAAKSVRRGTIVLAGGFAGTLTFTDSQEMPLRGFLERAYATGLLKGTSDALSIHLYSGNQRTMEPGSIFSRSLAAMREVRDANNQPKKHIWVTETGLSTSGWWALTPDAQSDGLIRRYRRLMTMDDVDAMIVHTATDQIERGKTHRAYGFGVAANAEPLETKPAFCAFAARASADPPGDCKPHIEGIAAKRCRHRQSREKSQDASAELRSNRLVRCLRREVRHYRERRG